MASISLEVMVKIMKIPKFQAIIVKEFEPITQDKISANYTVCSNDVVITNIVIRTTIIINTNVGNDT